MSARDPLLKPIKIQDLRPTQMTVGYREVRAKCKQWREYGTKRKQAEKLGEHMIPVVLGPQKVHYIVDHHHLARALHEDGFTKVLVSVVADLSMVDVGLFWHVLDAKRWVYPYDAKGERHLYKDIPKTVDKLKDDPYRSLAGELRRAGGFAKDITPFSEFLWADYLRPRVSAKRINADFDRALEKALAFAKSKEAIYLPGWCGPASDS